MARPLQSTILAYFTVKSDPNAEATHALAITEQCDSVERHLFGQLEINEADDEEDVPAVLHSGPSTSGDTITTESPRKLRRTWSPKQKRMILDCARHLGTKSASKQYGVSPSLVRKWNGIMNHAIQQSLCEAHDGGTGLILPDELEILRDRRAEYSGRNRVPVCVENGIAVRIQHLRSLGIAIDQKRIRSIARGTLCRKIEHPDESQFKASENWARKFIKRNRFRRRRITRSVNPGIDTPEQKNSVRRLYLSRLAWVQKTFNIRPELCFHADETGLQLLPNENYTYEKQGSNDVKVSGYGDKRQITVMLGGSITGTLLRPFVIFSGISPINIGKALDDIDYGSARQPFVWARTNEHWMNIEAVQQWIEHVLVPAAKNEASKLGLPDDSPVLLTWDVYTSHRQKELLAWLHENHANIRIVFVPAKCTLVLHAPLNRP